MFTKLFALALLVCALSFNVRSQETVTNGAKTLDRNKIVSADDAAKNALNVGAKMPSFSLKDSNGKTIESVDLLKQANLVVVFYRGSWCPFCNRQLS